MVTNNDLELNITMLNPGSDQDFFKIDLKSNRKHGRRPNHQNTRFEHEFVL